MAEARVQTWPLAVVGSVLLHGTVLTGLYVLPRSALSGDGTGGRAGLAATSALNAETTPIYILPDELPADVAAKLEKDRSAGVKPTEVEPRPSPEVAVAPPPVHEMAPLPVELGDPDSKSTASKTSWIKNDAPGEHSARPSEVDQPPRDIDAKPTPVGDPGQGGKDGKNGAKESPVAPPTPVANPNASPTDTADAKLTEVVGPPSPAVNASPAQPASEESVGPEAPKSALPEGPKQDEVKRGNSGGEAPKNEQAASAPAARPASANPASASEGAAAKPATAPGTAQTVSTDAPGQAGSAGMPTASQTTPGDRDSDAASVKRSAVFRNGKVEAGEGLDIRTVRPVFPLVTRALISPGSPTLEIVFGKDGRARKVRVIKSSGFAKEVDGPVVSALYNWRAKGRVLDELPARPDATVSLEITIILQ